MLCERCKKEEASIHLTEIIKDVKSEVHLCETCARDIGLNSKLSNFSLSVPEMLSFLEIDEVKGNEEQTMCKTCGLTFLQYSGNGKLGCPDCYTWLENPLSSVIKSYHGDRKHIGKAPRNFCNNETTGTVEKKIEQSMTVQELRTLLQNAVMEERYEEAAVLRDSINNAMEND
jgi:protein arginine kinase activator